MSQTRLPAELTHPPCDEEICVDPEEAGPSSSRGAKQNLPNHCRLNTLRMCTSFFYFDNRFTKCWVLNLCSNGPSAIMCCQAHTLLLLWLLEYFRYSYRRMNWSSCFGRSECEPSDGGSFTSVLLWSSNWAHTGRSTTFPFILPTSSLIITFLLFFPKKINIFFSSYSHRMKKSELLLLFLFSNTWRDHFTFYRTRFSAYFPHVQKYVQKHVESLSRPPSSCPPPRFCSQLFGRSRLI